MLVDSHCHLNMTAEEGPDVAELIRGAQDSGVSYFLNISTTIRGDFKAVYNVAQTHKSVFCTVGTHPHNAGEHAELNVSEDELVELANQPKVIGIGETGLDYFYDHAPQKDQETSFRKHLRACKRTGLPVIIHARDADEDMARILKEESAAGHLLGVMHCFSSGRALAEAALEVGFYISFSGILTFNKAEELREIAANVPADRLLVETDAPYLAPAPHRGKRNQPAYVVHTAAKLAEVKNMTDVELAAQTTENFFRLFKKAEQTQK